MSIDETLDGAQWKSLAESLQSAFTSVPELAPMVRYGLDEGLYNIVPNNATLPIATFELIAWAKAAGRLSELIVAARNTKPGNPRLRRFAETVDLAPQSQALESIYSAGKAVADVDGWKTAMSLCELTVCRIEVGGAPLGTGFLVGPNLVITARHVLTPVWNGAPANSVVCRFDYKSLGIVPPTMDGGVKFDLADTWLIDQSPTTRDGLDFVMVALNEAAGEMPVSGQADAPKRGWLKAASHNVNSNENLFIIQHPNATPMKLGVGKIGKVSASGERFCHDTDTDHGSSGSPCFTMDWKLIGLHQHGGNYSSECVRNGAINMAAIVKRNAVALAIP